MKFQKIIASYEIPNEEEAYQKYSLGHHAAMLHWTITLEFRSYLPSERVESLLQAHIWKKNGLDRNDTIFLMRIDYSKF